jgi:hypothetical protein
MGRHGLGDRNKNGEVFVDFFSHNGLVIGGTLYIHKNMHKETWTSPDSHTRNQIDHISILSKWRKLLLNVREYRWADIDSDHHLVIGEVKVRIARVKQNGGLASKKFNYQKLLNAETKDAFLIELKNRLSVLKVEEGKSSNTLWEETKEVFTGTSKEVLGYMTKEKIDVGLLMVTD